MNDVLDANLATLAANLAVLGVNLAILGAIAAATWLSWAPIWLFWASTRRQVAVQLLSFVFNCYKVLVGGTTTWTELI